MGEQILKSLRLKGCHIIHLSIYVLSAPNTAETSGLQFCRCDATLCSSWMLFIPIVLPSLMIVLQRVSFGLPLFLWPSAVHFVAWRGRESVVVHSKHLPYVCPSFFPYCCGDILLLCIFSYGLVCFQFLPTNVQKFSKASIFILFSSVFVIFQLLHPCVSTYITLELNSLSFVCLFSIFDFQMVVSWFKAYNRSAERNWVSKQQKKHGRKILIIIILPVKNKHKTSVIINYYIYEESHYNKWNV